MDLDNRPDCGFASRQDVQINCYSKVSVNTQAKKKKRESFKNETLYLYKVPMGIGMYRVIMQRFTETKGYKCMCDRVYKCVCPLNNYIILVIYTMRNRLLQKKNLVCRKIQCFVVQINVVLIYIKKKDNRLQGQIYKCSCNGGFRLFGRAAIAHMESKVDKWTTLDGVVPSRKCRSPSGKNHIQSRAESRQSFIHHKFVTLSILKLFCIYIHTEEAI